MSAEVLRPVVAVLLAPALAAMLFSLLAYSQRVEGWDTFVLLYLIFSYAFALLPAAFLLLVLKTWEYLRFWHFTVAGLVLGFACGLVFAMDDPVSFGVFAAIGAAVGGAVWLISEWRPPWDQAG